MVWIVQKWKDVIFQYLMNLRAFKAVFEGKFWTFFFRQRPK